MARQASIATGMTVAEYYRDMGHDVVLLADSTSRWAEALREFASRSGQLPAEEGFPANLASEIAAFYERGGRFATLGGDIASVTVIGAVSPPGGDMTEPVTIHTERFVRSLWSLDRDLAYSRHYPAVSWQQSFSRDAEAVGIWHVAAGERRTGPGTGPAHLACSPRATALPRSPSSSASSALPDRERMVLLGARLAREAVLQQSALSDNDATCSADKQLALVELVLAVHDATLELAEAGVRAATIEAFDLSDVVRARDEVASRRRRGGAARSREAVLQRLRGRLVSDDGRIEYVGARDVEGPLLVVAGVSGVGWDEFATIRLASGERREALVLEVRDDVAVVQVLEGSSGIDPASVSVRFTGRPFEIPVGVGWLGRVWNGLGAPLDGGPPMLGGDRRPVSGAPMNPTVRERSRRRGAHGRLDHRRSDHARTRTEAPDLLRRRPSAPRARRPDRRPVNRRAAKPSRSSSQRWASPTPMQPRCEAVLEERAAAGDLALFLNTAEDPVVERILTPRVALTLAEYLAFDLGQHVLVVLADMTSYCEAVREVSAARGEIPGRRAYPGYLYSDLASLYERCGRMRGQAGSVTLVPVLTMPGGDITHPVPDLTGYITEGQIVLSAELQASGVYPPVDILGSLSRLMRKGAGPGRTRDDHLEIAAQLIAAEAHAARTAGSCRADRPGRSHRYRPRLPLLRRRARVEVDEPAEGRDPFARGDP